MFIPHAPLRSSVGTESEQAAENFSTTAAADGCGYLTILSQLLGSTISRRFGELKASAFDGQVGLQGLQDTTLLALMRGAAVTGD